jgi:hypothetical protein
MLDVAPEVACQAVSISPEAPTAVRGADPTTPGCESVTGGDHIVAAAAGAAVSSVVRTRVATPNVAMKVLLRMVDSFRVLSSDAGQPVLARVMGTPNR